VAYEWTGALPDPTRSSSGGGVTMPPVARAAADVEVHVRKPGVGPGSHGGH
jgi:hypothetical protein